MPFCCCAYGLRLHSNVFLASLLPLLPFDEPDAHLNLGFMPRDEELASGFETHHVSPGLVASGEPILRVWKHISGRAFRLRYADGIEFLLDSRGTTVWATWPDSMTLEDTATYLLGPILGFVLRLRGVACLHASAVAVRSQGIALVGPPGAGKSTTAAALARRGLAVLSDDVVALEQRSSGFWMQPGYPRLNLWPDSVQALYGSSEQLPLITPGWEKRFLDLTQPPYTFQQQPLPLAAIYLLHELNSGSNPPRVETARARDALMGLVANTYASYLLDASMRAREFEFVGQVAANVPIRRVLFSRDAESFAQLPDVILSDFETLPSSSSVVPRE